MPASVRTSLRLFLLGLAVSIAIIPFDRRPWPPMPPAAAVVIAVISGVVIFGLLAFVLVRTYQGRNWARWVLLVLLLLAVPGTLRDAAGYFRGASVVTIVHASIFCLNVAAVALLFTRTSNLWYRNAPHKSPAS